MHTLLLTNILSLCMLCKLTVHAFVCECFKKNARVSNNFEPDKPEILSMLYWKVKDDIIASIEYFFLLHHVCIDLIVYSSNNHITLN